MSDLIAYKKDNLIIDLQSAEEMRLSADSCEKIYLDNSRESLEILRHSTAHLMAQAIKSLFSNAKFFVGPVVNEGFYYDFKVDEKITQDDLGRIEAKMCEIARISTPIMKIAMTRNEAESRFQNDELKMAVMSRIKGDKFSAYKQGDFIDLCRGPHIPNVGLIRHFKLTKLAGAYLGGDESAEMLTRIYGIAFASKKALKEYEFMMQEAAKRDHRKLGNELDLFCFDDEVGAGLPIWLPKGARLRKNIENILTKALIAQDYEPVRGPEILKSDLWKISGHYDNYKENMYFTTIDEQEYGIKPMNCLGHIKVYKSALRSYRDLPLRFYEYGVVHRHEKSGVLHGLLRVREFTQDDAHIFCRANQIEGEIERIIDFAKRVLEKFGFKYEMEISTRPAKFIGSEKIWEDSTNALKKVLETRQIPFQIDEGGGAFYGPKIDIKITDAIGRKWQCGTVQIDMNLPERFNLGYVDENSDLSRPVMIHRAILGSFERFVAILIEHFNSEFPPFIAPTQVIFVPINEEFAPYARDLAKQMLEFGAYGEINLKGDSFNKRIRTSEKQKVPFVAIIGKSEVEKGEVAIRDRIAKTQYNLTKEDFLKKIKDEMSEGNF